jgi:DNA-binding SARP family transcriptional activator
LLGPARVDALENAQFSSKQSIKYKLPRFRSRRTIGLLGYLATEQRPVARDLLVALFWPDESSSVGRANLSRELHNLAQVLPCCWESDRQKVTFIPAVDTFVDIYQLQKLIKTERWGEASELLNGEFLEGLYLDHNTAFEDWLLAERERWRGYSEDILKRLIDGHTRRGQYTEALNQSQSLVQFSPWNETAHRNVMRLMALTGQRGAALRQFETCRSVLRK